MIELKNNTRYYEMLPEKQDLNVYIHAQDISITTKQNLLDKVANKEITSVFEIDVIINNNN